LEIHDAASRRLDRASDDCAVALKQLAVGVPPKPFQEARRPLDVREKERDSSLRQRPPQPHAQTIARKYSGVLTGAPRRGRSPFGATFRQETTSPQMAKGDSK
jgi:hypothetical protein